MPDLAEATNVLQVVGNQEDVLKFVLKRYQSAYDDTAIRRQKYDDWYNLYRCYRTPDADGVANEERSNVTIPLDYQAVETILARHVDAFFGRRPYYKMMGRDPSDDERAQLLTLFTDFQLEESRFYSRAFRQAIKDMLIYGTGITKMSWNRQTEMVPDIVEEEILGQIVPRETMVEKLIAEGPIFDPVHVKDFFIDPEEPNDLDGARYCGVQLSRSMEYLKEMEKQGIYKNINAIEQPTSPSSDDDSGYKTGRQADDMNEESNDRLGMVHLIEYFEDERIVVIANKEHVIRDTPNPFGFKPFVIARMNLDTAKFWGRGLIECPESLSHLTASLFNVGMDNLNFLINPQMIVNELAVDDESELVNAPGSVVHVRGPAGDAIRYIEAPQLSADFYRTLSAVQSFHQKTTGAIDLLQGVSLPGVGTATEASIIAKEGISRIQMELKTVEEEYMKPAILKLHKMNRLFLSQQKQFRVLNYPGDPFGQQAEFQEIGPSDFNGQFDIIFESASRFINEQKNRADLLQLMQVIAGNPALINVQMIIIEKLMNLSGIHPGDELKQAMLQGKELMAMILQAQLSPDGPNNAKKQPQNREDQIQSENFPQRGVA